MPLKTIKALLRALPLCLLIAGFGPAAEAAVSKTSKRVIRFSANPALTVVPGFTASAVSKTQIQWSWSTGSFTGSGIDGYKLHSSSTADVIPLSPGTSFYIDSGLGYNKAYTRWITSYQAAEQGSDSEHLVKYTFAEAPLSFNLRSVTAASAYIDWHYSSATAYAVEYSTDGGIYYARNRAIFVPWQTLQLLSNRNYRLRIGALNGDEELTPGEYSAEQFTTTPPLDLSLTAVTNSSYTIEWRWDNAPFADTDITGFKIYRSSTAEFGIPGDADAGGVLMTLTPQTTFWIETFANGSANTGDKQHARWIKAFGVLESVHRTITNKYTYAVAPLTCALLDTPEDYLNIFETSLNLAWPAGRNASKYPVEYSTAANFAVSMSSFVAGSGLSTSVTGLTPNTKYDLRVGAINGDNEQTPENARNPEAYSSVYKVVTRPPAPVTTVSPVTDTIIKLSWSTAAYTGMPYLDGYIVSTPVFHQDLGMFVNDPLNPLDPLEVFDPLAPFDPVIYNMAQTQFNLDYRLTNSTHTMAVSVHQTCPGYAAYGSLVINDTGSTFATPPNDVSFDTVTARTVSVWWRHPEVPATQYRVERSTNTGERGPWVFISTAAGTKYLDSGLSPSTTYSYRIGAINLVGLQTVGLPAATGGFRRDYSFVSSTITKHVAPTLSGTPYGTGSISWSWTNSVPGVLTYNIYTSTYGLLAAGLTAGTTFWIETSLPGANASYTREIASLRSDGMGEFGEASAATLAQPPSALAASATSQHYITLGWSGNGGTRYKIDRSLDAAAWTSVKVWADSHTAVSFTDTGLNLNTTYYYAVSAYNQAGALSLSSAVSAGILTLGMPPGVVPVFSTATAAQTMSVTGQMNVSLPGGAAADGYMFFSTNAFTAPAGISKTNLDASIAAFSPNTLLTGSMVELHLYDLSGGTVTSGFGSPATITLNYPDATNDGLVDNITPQPGELTLKIFTLDASTLKWMPENSSVVNTAANTVSASISHFSFYALGSVVSVTGEISGVYAYPNPYKPGSSGSFGQSAFGEGVVFESLPARSKVQIFNIAGGLVREISDDDGDGRVVWDARNRDGARAASGSYLYLVTSPSGGKHKGRIAIIK